MCSPPFEELGICQKTIFFTSLVLANGWKSETPHLFAWFIFRPTDHVLVVVEAIKKIVLRFLERKREAVAILLN